MGLQHSPTVGQHEGCRCWRRLEGPTININPGPDRAEMGDHGRAGLCRHHRALPGYVNDEADRRVGLGVPLGERACSRKVRSLPAWSGGVDRHLARGPCRGHWRGKGWRALQRRFEGGPRMWAQANKASGPLSAEQAASAKLFRHPNGPGAAAARAKPSVGGADGGSERRLLRSGGEGGVQVEEGGDGLARVTGRHKWAGHEDPLRPP